MYKKYRDYNLKIVINKKLKHSYIQIDKNKNILLKTPNNSQVFIDKILEEKSSWIQKQFLKIDNFISIEKEELYSQKFIEGRVVYFSQLMQLEYSQLKFKKMKSRWGSCNSHKVITLNSELTRIKKELIDYVVVHELAHLKYMNHSKIFHQLVEEFLLNANKYRKELKNIKIV